jgi:hypothetical protein
LCDKSKAYKKIGLQPRETLSVFAKNALAYSIEYHNNAGHITDAVDKEAIVFGGLSS